MADSSPQTQRTSEEIDLLVVIERAMDFISRHKKVILIFTLIGGLVGAAFHKLKRKSYESSLILHSQLLTNSEEIAIVGNWNGMLKEEDYGVLRQLWNCGDSLLEEVSDLSAAAIQNNSIVSGFIINVAVKNPAILPQLQTALVSGLQNSDFVREKLELRKTNVIEMIATLNREIAKIDSFDATTRYGGGSKTNGTTVLNLSDTNSSRVILQQRLNDARDALKFINPIQVLQNFPISEKPRGMRLSAMAAIGAVAGLFIGFLLSLYQDLKRAVKALRESRLAAPPQKDKP